MINKEGYRIESPHLRIGEYSKMLRNYYQFDSITTTGTLLITDKGHDIFEPEDYDKCGPLTNSIFDDINLFFYDPTVFQKYEDYFMEECSLFAIFVDTVKEEIISIYSIWDNYDVVIYFDEQVDSKEILKNYSTSKAIFPARFMGYTNYEKSGEFKFMSEVFAGRFFK